MIIYKAIAKKLLMIIFKMNQEASPFHKKDFHPKSSKENILNMKPENSLIPC